MLDITDVSERRKPHETSHASLDGITPATFASRCAALNPVAAFLTSNRYNESEIITNPFLHKRVSKNGGYFTVT